MAKSEKKALEPQDPGIFAVPNPEGNTFSGVPLRTVSLDNLISYKKIADLMFKHYDDDVKSLIGEYDPVTKENYEDAIKRSNYFRDIRECIREEMEQRLLELDCSIRLGDVYYRNEEVLA